MSFSTAQETGRPVAIRDEGVTLTANVGSIDFTGAGVSGSIIGSDVTENIPGGSGTVVTGETPTGAINGVNLIHTIAHTPTSGTFWLSYGTVLTSPEDYSLSGTTITMTYALVPGNKLQAFYSY